MDYSKLSDCIFYQGHLCHDGYGRRHFNGKTRGAHRLSYCESHGLNIEDIKGKVVMHSCDNPSCINPAHLTLGTQKENVQDMVKKGRVSRKYGNTYQAKLNATQVAEIRSRYQPKCKKNGGKAMAMEFGVTAAAISLIVNNKNWEKKSPLPPEE